MNKSYFYIVVLLLFFFKSNGQTFKGKVVDENNKPLMGAAVYYDGTSLGVLTSRDGFFNIKIPQNHNRSTLVISYLGYKEIVINEFLKSNRIYKLEKSIDSLDTVNIFDSPFSREEMFEAFENYFLGTGRPARKSKILNPEDVILYYLKKTNTLYARSNAPIQVQNDYLGYNIKFDLKTFEVKFITESLDDQDMKKSYYDGYSFFVDINPKKKRKRERIYKRSLEKFFKSLIENNSENANFYVYYDILKRDPDYIFNIDPLKGNQYKVALKPMVVNYFDEEYYPSDIILRYKDKMTSTLKFQKPYTIIDEFGHIIDGKSIIISGDLAEYRLAKMLPTNYTDAQE